jgi:hypothetical protein
MQLTPGRWLGVAVAQKRADGGQFPDVADDRVPLLGPDVMPVGGEVTFVLVDGAAGLDERSVRL